jgi:exonuclease SbcC
MSNNHKVDDVMIYLVDEKGRRDILEASGAELAIVSLVLRAALANLLSFRTGTHVELFIVDEGMGVFDDQYLSIVKSIFNQLGTIFQKILLITHIPELKGIAQSTLEVYNDGLISKIRES